MARPYRGPVILKVRIDEALRRRLEAEALRRASTMSQVTRELLHLHLPALPQLGLLIPDRRPDGPR